MEEVTKAAALIGVDGDYFVDTFMKPKLKVIKTVFHILASHSSIYTYHPNYVAYWSVVNTLRRIHFFS